MNIKYFKLCEKLSYKSNHSQHRLGCVIVKKNRIVGLGFNSNKTSPHSPDKFKTIHAEFDAICGISPNDLKDSTAYILRIRKDGSYGMSKPCETCLLILKHCGVERICYTTQAGGYNAEKI